MAHPARIQPGSVSAEIATVLGMATLWPLFHSYPYHTIIRRLLEVGSPSIPPLFYIGLPCLLATAILAYAVLDDRLSAQDPKARACVGGTGGALGYLCLMACASYEPETAQVVTVIAGLALLAVSTVVLAVEWARRCALPSNRSVYLDLVLSFLAYEILNVVNELAPGTFSLLLPVCPAVSAACLCLLCRTADPAGEPARSQARLASALPLPTVVMGALFVFFDSLYLKVQFAQSGGETGDMRFVTSVVVFCLLVPLAFFISRRGFDRRSSYLIFTAFLVAYLAALLVVLLFSSPDAILEKRVWSAAGISIKEYTLLVFMLCMRDHHLNPAKTMLLYLALFVAAPFVFAMDWLGQGLPVATLASAVDIHNAGQVALFAIAVAAIGTVTFQLSKINGEKASDRTSSRDDLVSRAVATYGMTAREEEICALVYRGYTAKRIGDSLGLSENTVYSHLGHIYRKAGIHTRQELIDLIDGAA